MKTRMEQNFSTLGVNNDPWSIGEIFLENTKLNQLNSREYGIHIEVVGSSDYFLKRMTCPYKINPLLPAQELQITKPTDESNPNLQALKDILVKRRTRREFSAEPLGFGELSDLIYYSSGITATVKHHKTDQIMARFRAYPSGGGLFPIEIYVAAFRIDGMESGIYHYNVRDNKFEQMALYHSDYLINKIKESCTNDPLVEKSNAVVFISCAFRRTNFKYNERGFRFAFIEAGHCCQNIYLMAEAMELGVVSLGGFYDDEVNEILGIDGVNESVVYPVVIGKRKQVAQLGNSSNVRIE
jgi:SagB-type dehydrogenase family enzyme